MNSFTKFIMRKFLEFDKFFIEQSLIDNDLKITYEIQRCKNLQANLNKIQARIEELK